MNNFVAAVRAGQPVAIFEDPLPVLMNSVQGTSQPRRGGGGAMAMFQQQSQPKGDLSQLWDVLGLELSAGSGRRSWGKWVPRPMSSGRITIHIRSWNCPVSLFLLMRN